MDLRNLITVKTILEMGTFQNAAKRLNYTQSTVTFQVQQLEQELSIKLFEKIGRKMILTQAGKDILPYIDTIIQSTEQISNYGKGTLDLTGSLRIALPETLLVYKMQPVLKAFRKQAPNVRIHLQTLNCYTIRDKIMNNGADIGIHYDVGGYTPAIRTEFLANFSLSLIASPAIAADQTDFLTENQRKTTVLISNDSNSIFQKLFDHYLEEKNISIEQPIELWSIEAIKKCVISDMGIAFLPTFTVENELNKRALQALATDLNDQRITAVCAYHKNKWLSPAMELFICLLKKYLLLKEPSV
ncbi:LysR family transcriptional regulator [Pectinatus haikarae]|uniref:DNA-binding transcriptional LysR family regulator n=1 Tax=Pectinatus haikarae TaxID=349096 RepID=A0ABT9YAA3_9FIRM|nr:LysR family transcriptional regulator [Pectinatus haikarae]MDQ0204758.1 DNA-binding transcriptional LysR family regulator [Pectinatus haikarae]